MNDKLFNGFKGKTLKLFPNCPIKPKDIIKGDCAAGVLYSNGLHFKIWTFDAVHTACQKTGVMSKKVESILENFINNEINATEQRITAIRTFVETLRTELVSYSSKIPEDPSEKKYIMMVLQLFKDMIRTYDDEIKVLTAKREKMLEHLLNVRSVVTYLKPDTAHLTNLHIN